MTFSSCHFGWLQGRSRNDSTAFYQRGAEVNEKDLSSFSMCPDVIRKRTEVAFVRSTCKTAPGVDPVDRTERQSLREILIGSQTVSLHIDDRNRLQEHLSNSSILSSNTSFVFAAGRKHNFVFTGILSLIGNSILLFIALRKRHMLKPAEYFIVNLAISDLSMIITLLPLAIPSLFAHRWLFSQRWCNFYAFCGLLFGVCSLTNLTMLSIICCMKVCYPLYANGNRITSEFACLLTTSAWAYASIFAISPLVEWGHYGPEPYGTACCIDWKAPNSDAQAMSYIIVLFVFCYIVPSGIIMTSYTLILLTVNGSRRAVQRHMSPQRNLNNAHKLIVKLSVSVCIGFSAAWTPYAITAMWAALGNAEKVPPLAFALSALFAKSSTLYNPFVHLIFKPNFRNFLRKDWAHLLSLCRKQCGHWNNEVDLTLQTACDSITLNSFRDPNRFAHGYDACNTCTDTFEYFSNNTKSQGSAGSTSKADLLISSDDSQVHRTTKVTTLVMLTGSIASSIDNVEVSINVLPTKQINDLT
ncbi:opsin-5-like [Hemitrygon akajei]|uniref:opsin-5-like n=1 Tax=Hemitrygon akajei TaxID=2704970 RepID=UPI003BF9D3CD